MATKNVAEVVIAGKVLKITGYESVEYLHQIASYINDKIGDLEQLEGYRRQSGDEKQLLLNMNLADDYFKSKHLAERQQAELDKKEKEMYSLKHDLIEAQMAKENLDKTYREEAVRQMDLLKEKDQQLEQQQARMQELKDQLKLMNAQLQEARQATERQETENKTRYNRGKQSPYPYR